VSDIQSAMRAYAAAHVRHKEAAKVADDLRRQFEDEAAPVLEHERQASAALKQADAELRTAYEAHAASVGTPVPGVTVQMRKKLIIEDPEQVLEMLFDLRLIQFLSINEKALAEWAKEHNTVKHLVLETGETEHLVPHPPGKNSEGLWGVLYGVRYEAVPVVAVSPAGVVTAVDEETWASGVKDREGE
jgi:hypothetical protein